MAPARLNLASCSPTGLLSLDWTAPWLMDWRVTAEPVLSALIGGASLLDALNAQSAPVKFVAQTELPSGMAYEAFIAQRQCVPTRDDLHDALNALVWLRFPQTKKLLNRLQMQEITLRGISNTRGPLRDAVTVFDENGAVLVGTHAMPVTQKLRDRSWLDALHFNRADWQAGQLQLVLFGHALIEKLARPRLAIVAHVFSLAASTEAVAAPRRADDLDSALAQSLNVTIERLRDAQASGKPFTPVPVLGIPGWHQGNASADFYADTGVFRPWPRFSPGSDRTPAQPPTDRQSSS